MNEWFKKTGAKFKENWSKWSIVQKLILLGVVVVIIAVIVVMARTSSKPSGVPLFNTVISSQTARENILFRLDEENVKYSISSDGKILVDDDVTARRMRNILIDEDLVPNDVDPWGFLNVSQYSITDFERENNKNLAVKKSVKAQLEALSDVASADVEIGFPDDALFTESQKPVTASVILTFKQGSDITPGSKKVRTIQKILLHSVVGLKEENITISSVDGVQLNDFSSLESMDRLNQAEREQKLRTKHEVEVRAKVLKALQSIFTPDRIRQVVVKIDWDMSEVVSDKTIYSPVEITPQDPEKPYDTRVTRDYLPLSSQTVTREWTGTGYNPEGPAGVDGQNPPVYSDMSNVIGRSTETGVTQNNVINTEQRHETVHSQPGRVSVAVNIDGRWKAKYDKNHNYVITEDGHIDFTYTPVSAEVLDEATKYVQSAIGYNKIRGDSVSVTSIQIDRDEEFQKLEDEYFAAQKRKFMIMIVLGGIILVLLAFIIFRFVSREIERRRRLREEEILRRQQAEREKALWEAKDQDMQVTMSVEERKRAELQENAIAMAKEHPDEVAMLIKTWLMDDNN
ncbi:MAG: flagellar M-ring protein FliF [Treponema sp.]|nr:flagellar M-ring protein FliF [Treponema sp.]